MILPLLSVQIFIINDIFGIHLSCTELELHLHVWKLIIYSPFNAWKQNHPGKPRKCSEEAFIILINQDPQQNYSYSFIIQCHRVPFHFPCRCFWETKKLPTICKENKYCVIWHESQMHTGAWSGLFGSPLQLCCCNNRHPHLFWASFAPCFLTRGGGGEREGACH